MDVLANNNSNKIVIFFSVCHGNNFFINFFEIWVIIINNINNNYNYKLNSYKCIQKEWDSNLKKTQ